tara:strand:+ start:184 stop:621 length:438 start_codon:yes stop_codon:yes gene_type:complete
MDAKTILDPKWWLIGVGAMMLLLSSTGIMDGESWAESGWGAENVAEHDAEYEQMWALHMMPLATMAIATGLLVKGKPLAQMALAASASIIVFIMGGMLYLTSDSGYGSDQGALIAIPALLVVMVGVSGYLHLNDEEAESEPVEEA